MMMIMDGYGEIIKAPFPFHIFLNPTSKIKIQKDGLKKSKID